MVLIVKYYFLKMPVVVRYIVAANILLVLAFLYGAILSSIWEGKDLFGAWIVTLLFCLVNWVAYLVYSAFGGDEK